MAVFDVVFAVTAQRPSGVSAKSDGERLGVAAISDPYATISTTAANMNCLSAISIGPFEQPSYLSSGDLLFDVAASRATRLIGHVDPAGTLLSLTGSPARTASIASRT